MTAPKADLKTNITRDQPVTQTAGSIQVAKDALDESAVLLSFGGEWGTTYAELTPAEAQSIAAALEDTARELTEKEESTDA
ncbi:hypothetical protein ABNG03_03785 [Halorubrum sp. RMP-47]|uniref:Uncharacterized protein n=1 Tax=Halorubrum miltondacostae TaxID=3076378 RepID=A0ABD5M0Q5_9EURY